MPKKGQGVWACVRERNTTEPARLCRVGMIDCTREYTYGQIFTEWEHYARVFSALGMTEGNGSRVAIGGTVSAEPLLAFYGLNMTGAEVSMFSYPDFLPGGPWRLMVEREKITDLVLSDIMVTPDQWPELEREAKRLGVRHIIFLHSHLGGPCTGPAELVYNEFNYRMLRRMKGTVFMDDLLKRYTAAPIAYGSGDPDRLALITHTSGTTRGTRKPLPYTNRSVNNAMANLKKGFHALLDEDDGSPLRWAPSFDFSSFLCFSLANACLAYGDTVVLTFFGFMHPRFIRAVEYYKTDFLFVSGFMIDRWMRQPEAQKVSLASVKILSYGGSYTPPEKIRRYQEFIRARGCRGKIIRGYGMSETGGAQIECPPNCEEDILGYPRPKENYRIQDENDGQFYTVDDGPRTGVMYVASDSLCMNELDGVKLFDYTPIDGRDFLCSNDLVRVNTDGSFSYAGRADRFFVNNDGVRFDAGLVETALSRQPGIHQCALVPVLDKRIHDTVPVLYVMTEEQEEDGAVATVRGALTNAFLREGLIEKSILPSQFVLVDHIPCNSNGKIDIYRITRDRLKGVAYDILPVREGDGIREIACEKAAQTDSFTGGALPEGMEGRSAFGLYDLLNS